MEAVTFDRPLISRSPDETEAYAKLLYGMLTPGDIVGLYGPLGAGKSCFVRGVARAAGVDPDEVTSPSFTLINEYLGGEQPIFHFDLYRLQEPAEFYSTGGDDYFDRDGIVLIEWAEKGGEFVPRQDYLVRMEIVDENRRQLTFSKGPR